MDQAVKPGRIIKALRALRGWTQEDLGKRAGLSKMTISFAETGKSHVSRSSFYAIAAALGVPPESLIDPTPSAAPDGEEATP